MTTQRKNRKNSQRKNRKNSQRGGEGEGEKKGFLGITMPSLPKWLGGPGPDAAAANNTGNTTSDAAANNTGNTTSDAAANNTGNTTSDAAANNTGNTTSAAAVPTSTKITNQLGGKSNKKRRTNKKRGGGLFSFKKSAKVGPMSHMDIQLQSEKEAKKQKAKETEANSKYDEARFASYKRAHPLATKVPLGKGKNKKR
jgi:hypothetical protein